MEILYLSHIIKIFIYLFNYDRVLDDPLEKNINIEIQNI